MRALYEFSKSPPFLLSCPRPEHLEVPECLDNITKYEKKITNYDSQITNSIIMSGH